MTLTGEQRDAVQRLGQDVCVDAGPGSGKTRVLVERFRWRVEQGLSPLRILAVTFTEKAANEIKQRLVREFRNRPNLRAEIERAHVSTVHGFCARLLREHAIEAGIDPQFEVLEAADAAAELAVASEETLDAMFREQPGAMRALLEAVDFSDPAGGLASVYEAMRLTAAGWREPPPQPPVDAFQDLLGSLAQIVTARPQGWSNSQQALLEQVIGWGRRVLALPRTPVSLRHLQLLGEFDCDLRRLKRNNSTYEQIGHLKNSLLPRARQTLVAVYYAPQRALLREALERLDRAYRKRKEALAALDFADLEERAIRLLREDPALCQRVRESFDEVLMDEYQDTNPLQAELIGLIRRPAGFFAVGDINQSIYGFRHAEPRVFRDYREEILSRGQRVDRLRENHRTCAGILSAVRAIVTGAPGIEPHELIAARKFADDPETEASPVEVITATGPSTEEAAALEAQWVARRIRDLGRYSATAVLVRNVNALPPFERAFRDFGVPYVIARGKHFFEAQEVTDLLHWLRVLVNPRDEISLAAVLRSPLVGVSNETLLRLKQLGNLGAALDRLEGEPNWDPGDLERLNQFRRQLADTRAQYDQLAPDRLLARAIDSADYESALSPRARANVRKFLGLVREWFARRPRPLSRLVEDLESLRQSDPDEPTAPPDDSSNAVRVMTIHSAKGLEFPIVFLAALHKGVARNSPPLAFSPVAGLVARWRDPVTGEGVKDIFYTAFSDELKRKEEHEENRLFYVAMTRAEERLVLSFAATQRAPQNWAAKVVSGLNLTAASSDQPVPVRVLDVSTAPEQPAPLAAETSGGTEQRLARPQLTGQHDGTAAVTSVWLYQSCPRRYYLARYLGWDQPSSAPVGQAVAPASEDLDAGEFGTEVHDLLAGLPVKDPDPRALELAARFHASHLGRRAARAPRAEREFDFLMDFEDLLLHGRIDLWYEEAGELVLIDYKTDDVDAAESANHAAAYALQMRLYALALERLTGRLPGQACIYLLRPDLAVPIPLDSDSLEQARETVRALRRAQSTLDFPPRLGPHCYRCPYFRNLCPAA